MGHIDKRAIDLAARQGGVVTRRQAYEIGFTTRQITHRLSQERWHRIGDLGYRLIPASGSEHHLQAATVLLPDAVVSHGSAAFIHGLVDERPDLPTVSVHSRTTHVLPDVFVHRCHDLLDSHVALVGMLPVTTPERTLFDLAATTTVGRLAWMAVELARDRRLDFAAVERVVAEIGRRGKPGTARMRELLEHLEVAESADKSESPLERRGRRLLRRASCICGFKSEYPIPWAPRRRFDDAFPAHQLAVEWDSIRYHGQRDAFEVDRRRDRSALEHGWRVLRFTWSDVTERPDGVIETVRRTLRCRAEGTS